MDLETIEDGSYGRLWKNDAFVAGTDPFPDLYWVCSGPRRNPPGDWTGVRASAVLAEQVYVAPVTHPPHSSHFIAEHSAPAGPFCSPGKEVTIGMPRGVSDEHKARNEITS